MAHLRRPLGSLSQGEIESWLQHPSVGLDAFATCIHERGSGDDCFDGEFFEDSDLECDDLDEQFNLEGSADFYDEIVRARAEGVDPALLRGEDLAPDPALALTAIAVAEPVAAAPAPLQAALPPAPRQSAAAIAMAVALTPKSEAPRTATTVYSGRGRPKATDARNADGSLCRSLSPVRSLAAAAPAPTASAAAAAPAPAALAQADSAPPSTGASSSGDCSDDGGDLTFDLAALGEAAPPPLRADVIKFMDIAAVDARTATFYVDGAISHNRDVTDALAYFYDKNKAEPPDDYVLPAPSSSFDNTHGGKTYADADDQHPQPFAVGERIETQWWASGGSKHPTNQPSRGIGNKHTYYRGRITVVNGDGTYAVACDDGDVYDDAPHASIRALGNKGRTQTAHHGSWRSIAHGVSGRFCDRGATSTAHRCTHGRDDINAEHWSCCGCIDASSTKCIATRLSMYDFVKLRVGGIARTGSDSAAKNGELQPGEVGIIVSDDYDSKPYKVRCHQTMKSTHWYDDRDLVRVAPPAERPIVGDYVVLRHASASEKRNGLLVGEIGIVVSDDFDSKPYRLKTPLGISEHYYQSEVVKAPAELKKRADDAQSPAAAHDTTPFRDTDAGAACWLRESSQPQGWVEHGLQLRLVGFKTVKTVNVNKTIVAMSCKVVQEKDVTGVSYWLDSKDLQRWGPVELTSFQLEIEAAAVATESIADAGSPLTKHNASVGVRLSLSLSHGGGGRGDGGGGCATLLGWRAEDGTPHGDCSGALSNDEWCRVHFDNSSAVPSTTSHVGDACTVDNLRVGMRVTSGARTFDGHKGEGTILGWKNGRSEFGEITKDLRDSPGRFGARVHFDDGPGRRSGPWNVPIEALSALKDDVVNRDRCWNLPMSTFLVIRNAGDSVGSTAGSGASAAAYVVGARVKCNWWSKGGMHSGNAPSSGNGGRNQALPCVITAVNGDGTFAIRIEQDGDTHTNAPLSSMQGVLPSIKQGELMPLTPDNIHIGAKVEVNLDIDRLADMGVANLSDSELKRKVGELVGKVGGTVLGWRHRGTGHGDAPDQNEFCKVRMDEVGTQELPFPMLVIRHAGAPPSGGGGGGGRARTKLTKHNAVIGARVLLDLTLPTASSSPARSKPYHGVPSGAIRDANPSQPANHEVHVNFKNTTTSESMSAAVQTNDARGVSPDPAIRDRWIAKVTKEHAKQQGWRAEDTVCWIEGTEEPSRRNIGAMGQMSKPYHGVPSGCRRDANPGQPAPHEVHVQVKNTATAESIGSVVQTNDARGVSPDPAIRDRWIAKVTKEHAKQQGWRAEDTVCWIEGTEEPSRRNIGAMGQMPKPHHGVPSGCRRDANPGQPAPHEVHVQFKNTATAESIGSMVQTNDPRAVSADPTQRDHWIGNVAREQAKQQGWRVEDTVCWIEGTDEPHAGDVGSMTDMMRQMGQTLTDSGVGGTLLGWRADDGSTQGDSAGLPHHPGGICRVKLDSIGQQDTPFAMLMIETGPTNKHVSTNNDYIVGARVKCNWWSKGGMHSGNAPSSGNGGRNQALPCVITAVNGDGTFAILSENDGEVYKNAPLSSMIALLAGGPKPLSPMIEACVANGHSGEWRDTEHPPTGWKTYCKTKSSEGGNHMCLHGDVIRTPHWSCCGDLIRPEDTKKLLAMGFNPPAVAFALRTHGSLTKAMNVLLADPTGGVPTESPLDPISAAPLSAAPVAPAQPLAVAHTQSSGATAAVVELQPWIGAGFPPIQCLPCVRAASDAADGGEAVGFEEALYAVQPLCVPAERGAPADSGVMASKHADIAETRTTTVTVALADLTSAQVSEFLRNHKLSVFVDAFAQDEHDGATLNEVVDFHDLDDYKAKTMHKRKLVRVIEEARVAGVVLVTEIEGQEAEVDGGFNLEGLPDDPEPEVEQQLSEAYVHDEDTLIAIYNAECDEIDDDDDSDFIRERTALLLVVHSGRELPRLVEAILTRAPASINVVDASDHTPLMAAVQRGAGEATLSVLREADPVGKSAEDLWSIIESCGELVFASTLPARLGSGVRARLTGRISDSAAVWKLCSDSSEGGGSSPDGFNFIYRTTDLHEWNIGSQRDMEKNGGWLRSLIPAASPIGLRFEEWNAITAWNECELEVRDGSTLDVREARRANVESLLQRQLAAVRRLKNGVSPFEAAVVCDPRFRLSDDELATLFRAWPEVPIKSASSVLMLVIKAGGRVPNLMRAVVTFDRSLANVPGDGSDTMLPFERALQGPSSARIDDDSLAVLFKATDAAMETPCFGHGRTALHLAIAAHCSLTLTVQICEAVRSAARGLNPNALNELADNDRKRAFELAEFAVTGGTDRDDSSKFRFDMYALALQNSFPSSDIGGSRALTDKYKEVFEREIASTRGTSALDEMCNALVKGGGSPERLLLAAAMIPSIPVARVLVQNHDARGLARVLVDGRNARAVGMDSPVVEVLQYFLDLGTTLERYEVDTGRPVHRSKTAKVVTAVDRDASCDGMKLAIKWMSNFDEFEREIACRDQLSRSFHFTALSGSEEFADMTGPSEEGVVVEVVGWHTPPAGSDFHLAGPKLRTAETSIEDEYPYVLVMKLGGESLHHVVASQRIAGVNVSKVQQYLRCLVTKVRRLHDGGLIHCDLKPRNLLCNESDELILCDLDAASPLGAPLSQHLKSSTAYYSPEAARMAEASKLQHAHPVELLYAEPSIDVWSIGVIAFELCSGRNLFPQDISNDNMVDPRDARRICLWNGISDAELEMVLPLELGGNVRQSAKHLIRSCLQGDRASRPSLEELAKHPFLNGLEHDLSSESSEHCPISKLTRQRSEYVVKIPDSIRMRYHVFISHSQVEASGDVGTLFHVLATLGLHCWRDMSQRDVTTKGMRQGVYDSDFVLIFLTNSMLSRPYCIKEIEWALDAGKPILIVKETEERFWQFDINRWRRDECVRDTTTAARWRRRDFGDASSSGAVSYAACPDAVKRLIEDAEKMSQMLPFRRRDFEVCALARELVVRAREHTDANIAWGAIVPPDEIDRLIHRGA